MAYIKMRTSLWHRHKNCECYVDRDYQPKKSQSKFNQYCMVIGYNPHPPALMCRQHNTWIKWLSYEEADEIEQVMADNHV